MLKRMVVLTGLILAAMLFVAQVVIPHARRSRANEELRLLGLEKGREIIMRAVESCGGLEAWQSKREVSFRLFDNWNTLAGAAFAGTLDLWPERKVATVQYYLLHRNAGRIEMTTPRGHHVWGYYNFRPWARLNQQVDEENMARANFTIPAINYLFGLPYRFLDNGAFPEFVNEVREGDRIYDRVRITFGLNAGRYPTDWYLADFDQETGRLAHLEYTMREKMPGYVHFGADFSEYQRIDDLWIPTQIDFKVASPLISLELNNWQITEVRFNTGFDESFFVPTDLRLTDAGSH